MKEISENVKAIDVVRQMVADGQVSKDVAEKYFPEFKDSEDETIRKRLIEYFKDFRLGTFAYLEPKKIIAWLEKQGEKPQGKSALEAVNEEKVDNANKVEPKDYNDIDPHFGKPIDKVEPKFKVGDWIVDKSGLVQHVLGFRGGIYTCTYSSFTTGCESNYHLWSIADAKDSELEEVFYSIPNGFHAEIEGDKVVIKKGEQKPAAWSEEDKSMLCYMEGHLEYLKNDKGYSSSEDQIMLKRQLGWLKTLKDRVQPQTTWKPSREQIMALRWVLNHIPYDSHKEEISGLLEQLKKLREE